MDERARNTRVGQVLERYRSELRRVVEVRMDPRLSARFDPSDVLQDVMIQAAPNVESWIEENADSVFACLYTLARDHLARLHRDHIHAQCRAVGRESLRLQLADDSICNLARSLAVGRSTPSQALARKEYHDRLRSALGQLREIDREVLVMRILEGMAVRNVSQVLGISEAAVKMRQLRALERMRHLMGESRNG